MAKKTFADIGKKLSRLFLGRIVVRKVGELHREEPVEIMSHFRTVSTNPLRKVPRVGAALFVKWKQTRAISAGAVLEPRFASNFRINKIPLNGLAGTKVIQYKLRLAKRASAKSGMWKVKMLPQSRRNRLNYLKKQPKFEKASLLALYSPIFHGKVKKSALDKSSGNLVLWYDNDRVKLGDKCHLLLLRVFGGGEPLKWVWLPADKKIV